MNFMNTVTKTAAAAALAIACIAGGPALAEYPDKPIKVYVGFSAGGGTDTYARTFASMIHEQIEMPMIIVNKTGASGAIAAKYVSKQKPDGYTLFFHSSGTFLIKALRGEMDVNVFDHFDVIAQVGRLTPTVVVPAASPYKTTKELMDAAKKNPGSLRWAHSGVGSVMHTAGVAFLSRNGLKAKAVPFKGGSKARAAMVANKVQFGILGAQQLSGFEKDLRPLGVSTDTRDVMKPKVPTLKEGGADSLNISSPMVLYAPKGTPKAVIDKLGKAIEAVTKTKGFKRLLKKAGLPIVYQGAAKTTSELKMLQDDLKPIVAETTKK
ncbi:MAG: tripartite tricarboxylate transporter substrate binding protein [Rhodospirillaceae bacterium]|jgi:tripartite-type tricarboxylate transporter receptor subunit TctC|nr:tripartite tricarboxylate transporter substrate binding protein [Rhodospirillaceae bacterium]